MKFLFSLAIAHLIDPTCRITMPTTHTIEELSKPKVISLPGNSGKYTYSVTVSGNMISVISNFQLIRVFLRKMNIPIFVSSTIKC